MPKQQNETNVFISNADRFTCSVLRSSPTPKSVRFSSRGLLFKSGRGPNMQHVTAYAFLLVTYSKYLSTQSRNVYCKQGASEIFATPSGLLYDAQLQVRGHISSICTYLNFFYLSNSLKCESLLFLAKWLLKDLFDMLTTEKQYYKNFILNINSIITTITCYLLTKIF